MGPRMKKDYANVVEQIKKIMDPVARRYLTVFRVNSERNLKQTIWHAIFKGTCRSLFNIALISSSQIAHFAETRLYRPMRNNDSSQSATEYSSKMNLLELAIKWNTFDQATDLLDDLQYSKVRRTIVILMKILLLLFRNPSIQQNYSSKLFKKIVQLLLTIFFEVTMIHVAH